MRLNKITKLKNGNQLFVYYANNAGRGDSNCTLMIVPEGEPRMPYSRMVKNVIQTALTSSWKSDINLSKSVLSVLGITKEDLILE